MQVGTIFDAVRPRLAVYSHLVFLGAPDVPPVSIDDLVEQTRQTYRGPLVVGRDLMSIEIGDKLVVFDPDSPEP